ncbi:hypothetical protein [Soonwooa sp.]|uniref:hypothetical protein n=1 Tax=Soonwooa sp. TaxID=1938592 RepID=UPI0028AD0920|nr:hypothetical protein [Soonwooa sp.]
MNKILLTLFGASLILSGCGDTGNKAGTSLVEKTIEAATGNKVDALDVNHIEDNNAVVDVTIGDENLQDHFKKGFGSITASKETIAITIAQVDNGQDNILIGFTGKDLTALRPIAGKMVKGENDGFTFSITRVTDNAMDVQLSFEAEGEIVSLQKDKIVIKVKGKTGSSADAENPEKWKSYEGTITMNYPVFQALGSEKEDFIY